MHRSILALFVLSIASIASAAERIAPLAPVVCEGSYAHHLQGVCFDGEQHIFWSFTTQLVKSDRDGKVLKQIAVGNHHGDACYHDGKVYVAVNFGKFNDAAGKAASWVYVYKADDLELLAKHHTPEVFHGAGGIAFHDGKFLVVGGLPPEVPTNFAYEYDADFKFQKKHVINSGNTLMGIQTAAFADGHWWFGCYGKPAELLKVTADLSKVERFEFDASLAIVPRSDGKFLVGRGACPGGKNCTGQLVLAEADAKRGLKLVTPAAK